MPSIELCSKRTPFSGDELQVFCYFDLAFRLLQLALGLSVLTFTVKQHKHEDRSATGISFGCRDQEDEYEDVPLSGKQGILVYCHAAISILVSVLCIITTIPILLLSWKGTPTNADPRKAIISFCYVNVTALNCLKVTGFVLSFFVVAILRERCSCDDEIRQVFRLREVCPHDTHWLGVVLALIATFIVDLAVVCAELLYFVCGRSSVPRLLSPESRLRLFVACSIACVSAATCCLFGGPEALKGDFGDLSIAVTNLTKNSDILDLTVSDILAGLIMVVRKQKEEVYSNRDRIQQAPLTRTGSSGSDVELSDKSSSASHSKKGSSDGQSSDAVAGISNSSTTLPVGVSNPGIVVSDKEVLHPDCRDEMYAIAAAARYIPLAHGIYTWMMYILEKRIWGMLHLFYLIVKRCACLHRNAKDDIHHDYPWQPHTIALEELSGVKPENLVFASFQQSIVAIPYMIALDHEWQTIVISIRGTLSIESFMADIAILPKSLVEAGEKYGFDGTGRYCHRGMLASSEWMYDDLQERGKLGALTKGEYKNYRLVVTGHSLGAGCAAILSLMLRPKYPDLQCLAFSVPGCVFSENLAKECSPWLISYVLDVDIVPRLSIQSFEDLRDSVLKMICRIQVPKQKVFYSARKPTSDNWGDLVEENEYFICDEDEVPDSDFKLQVDKFLEYQFEMKQKNEEDTTVELFAPGRIVQFLKIRKRKRAGGRDVVEDDDQDHVARWVDRQDLRKIVLSSHMFGDHEPGNLKRRINDIAQQSFHLKPPLFRILGNETV